MLEKEKHKPSLKWLIELLEQIESAMPTKLAKETGISWLISEVTYMSENDNANFCYLAKELNSLAKKVFGRPLIPEENENIFSSLDHERFAANIYKKNTHKFFEAWYAEYRSEHPQELANYIDTTVLPEYLSKIRNPEHPEFRGTQRILKEAFEAIPPFAESLFDREFTFQPYMLYSEYHIKYLLYVLYGHPDGNRLFDAPSE